MLGPAGIVSESISVQVHLEADLVNQRSLVDLDLFVLSSSEKILELRHAGRPTLSSCNFGVVAAD